MKKQYDVICIGMALVDSIIRGFDPNPVSASGYRAASGSLKAGGEAVNEAVTLAKLGMKTGLFCALGEDEAGDLVLGTLRRAGVDTGFIYRAEDRQTPVTTMFVREDGTRKSVTNTAHTQSFHPEQHPSRFTDARAVILGSLFRTPFDDPEIIRSVVRAAREAGEIVVADTKLPNFRVMALRDLRESLPEIDYITPNEDEARYYTGKEEPEEMAEVLLDYGVKNVLIKLGSRGCYMRSREFSVRLPAEKIRAVDATGAGDSFAAGFVSEILRGQPPQAALRFANACGALCAMAVGASAGIRDREQVLRFIEEAVLHEEGRG